MQNSVKYGVKWSQDTQHKAHKDKTNQNMRYSALLPKLAGKSINLQTIKQIMVYHFLTIILVPYLSNQTLPPV